jgi:TatD DNase family protein
MIDSHTHLDSCAPPNAELVAAAREAGVTKLLTVGTDEASNRTALAAADAFGEVWAAVGRHPNSAAGFDDAALADLRELARHPRCAAIGETGLDDFRDGAPREAQEHAFRAHIALARELDKPLVIHTRAAEEDTVRMLEEHAQGVRVLLHCFSMPERVAECIDNGWWFSFAGNVTYPKNAAIADAARRVPADRLLVETDAPYLTPQVVRKHKNQPAYVAHTAAFVAGVRGTPYAEFEVQVEANAAELYRW